MKNNSLFSALALAGLLTGPALAQDPAPKPAPSTALARIQSTFRAADTDKDKFISAAEAARAGIPTRDFAAHDGDRDRRLSESEFLLYYRFLLVKAKRPVDKDIEAEVARIQAALRARQAEEAKKNKKAGPKAGAVPEGAQDSGPDVTPARPTDSTGPAQSRRDTIERLRRARASLRESTDADTGTEASAASAAERASAMRLKQRSAQMRAKLAREEELRRKAADESAQDPGAKIAADTGDAATDAAELERRAEAMRLKSRSEEMRAKLAQEEANKAESGKDADAAGPGTEAAASVEERARRAEAMRLKTRSGAMRDKLAANPATAGESAPAADSADARARRYSSRFVDAGLMTVQEGRELAEALGSGRVAALAPAERSRLLTSLTQARAQVDTKLAAGKIDAREAESLKQLIDGHAKALDPVEKPQAPDLKRDATPEVKRDATPKAQPERGGEPAVGGDARNAPERPQSKGDTSRKGKKGKKGKKGDDAGGDGEKKGRG